MPTPPEPSVAFAGLGAMGFGMAAHLVKLGFPVTGYDIYPPSMEKLVATGGQAAAAATPREAVRDVMFLVCMVAKIDDAMALLFDPVDGAVVSMSEKATLLMCSTVAPADIEELTRRLKEAGRPDIRLIDSPVSGGARRAADGTLSIFAAGADADLDNAHLLLESMSSKLYRIPGGLGGGSKTKLIHQILAGVNIAMASEAMALAALAGLNTTDAFERLSLSKGASWMFDNRVPHMLDPSLPPYSSIAIIKKDVAIITSTAHARDHRLPMIEKAGELYEEAFVAGWEREDDCVVARLYLPGQPDLVARQASSFQSLESPLMSVAEIEHLMVGVHLAAMAEAMFFCNVLGIDADLMYDIVSNAAGASPVFVKHFDEMRKGNWQLNSIDDIEGIEDRLYAAEKKASDLGYRTTLSSKAKEVFQHQFEEQPI